MLRPTALPPEAMIFFCSSMYRSLRPMHYRECGYMEYAAKRQGVTGNLTERERLRHSGCRAAVDHDGRRRKQNTRRHTRQAHGSEQYATEHPT